MEVQNGLTRAEKQTIIIEAIQELTKDSNRVNLAQIGAAIRSKGLKYGKLNKMLLSFSNILAFEQDYEFPAPVTYVKLKAGVFN